MKKKIKKHVEDSESHKGGRDTKDDRKRDSKRR